ncbi:hypothetical protein PENTCL1PPCAC_20656, partial [Pristionchus entomophagus]
MNLIHRDLKPSNILFSEKDRLKLCDLGIATERMAKDSTQTVLTRTNIGTALYMSPEQSMFATYSSKTDVFSLGLILAELCIVMTTIERSKIFNNYRAGKQNNLIIDDEMSEIVTMLTMTDPKSRPSCREIL